MWCHFLDDVTYGGLGLTTGRFTLEMPLADWIRKLPRWQSPHGKECEQPLVVEGNLQPKLGKKLSPVLHLRGNKLCQQPVCSKAHSSPFDLLHSVWQSLGPSTSLQITPIISFYGWVIFHCICVPHLLYPFLCGWAFRLLPYPGYWK